ncbi:MAG: transcription antitermination factor NusB [Firmicutes bacterium]|nr:transcription antitermination factor NusB [Bacillota bacterium]
MSRRQAREMALQVLYAVEINKTETNEAFEYVTESFGTTAGAEEFARELVSGALDNQAVLDQIIRKLSRRWDFNRLALVDRNIIRLALFEMLYREDIPKAVSVNEAVDLAKVFGGDDSARFINGILGQVAENPEKYSEDQESEVRSQESE